MVVWRSAGMNVGVISLEREASKAGKIVFQAVIALCGARFKDKYFPYHRSSSCSRRISARVALDQSR